MQPLPSMVGLVLAGGGARGAWEAGVLTYLLRHIAPEVGKPVPFEILSGTSVGAYHAALLAAHAGDRLTAAHALERAWSQLVLDDVLRIDRRGIAAMLRGLLGRGRGGGHGALIDPSPFARMLEDAVPFERIDDHLAAGLLRAVTVSATQVATGRTAVFVARPHGVPVSLGDDPTMIPILVQLRAEHALASAAIPILFPAVSIDGDLFCDGGLRQLVPLRPALRLGARSLVVVTPRSSLRLPTPLTASTRERSFSSPVYLFGKVLDALLLDHVDADVERLEHVNAILNAGRRRYGPTFEQELAGLLSQDLHMIETSIVRPSESLGHLAADAVRSRRFAGRACKPAGRALRALAEADGSTETDLVSYLLFDGTFARELLDLGVSDARRQHDDLVAAIAEPQVSQPRRRSRP